MKKALPILLLGLLAIGLIGKFAAPTPPEATPPDAPALTHGHRLERTLSPTDLRIRWTDPAITPTDKAQILAQLRVDMQMRLANMREHPQAFLEKTPSLQSIAALPPALRKYFPQPFSAVGDMRNGWETRLDRDGSIICTHQNIFKTDGHSYHIVSDNPRSLPARRAQAVSGISLGDHLILHDDPVQLLSPEEHSAAQQMFPLGNPEGRDPLTGQPAEVSALLGGKVYRFSDAGIARMVGEELQRKNAMIFDWMAGDSGGDAGTGGATPYQENHINVLVIRASFPDMALSSVTQSDLQNSLASVNSKIADYSYGLAGITYTVSDKVYELPSDGSYYAASFSRNDELHADARALAGASDYTLANYEVIVVFFPNLSTLPGSQITYGGFADIGSRIDGASHWINGINSVEIMLHEFGHNYGLYHANYLHPEMALGVTKDYDLPGILEYGDIFDSMGKGNSPEAHFNPLAKNQLQWIPDSKIAEAGADGTWRIHRFDDLNALSHPTLALKVPMGGEVFYWLGLRQLYTSSTYNLSSAAYVVAENIGQGRETTLIDMTPESAGTETADRQDAGLPVGNSYYDARAGVRFESLAMGGTAPNQYIDVAVVFDPRIALRDTFIEVDEQSGSAKVVVQRSFKFEGTLSVDYATSDGTATSPSDYYPVSGTVNWEDGDSSDKEIHIPIRPDLINEGTEDLTLTLSNPVGGVLNTERNSLTVKILDPGQRYTTFAPPFFNTSVNAIVPLDNGQVIIAGVIPDGIGDFDSIRHIARLNADGSVDGSFVSGSGFNGEVDVISRQDDGLLLVAGDFTQYNGVTCPGLVRLSANGVLESAFITNLGTGANETTRFDGSIRPHAIIRSIAIENDGGILLGGDFSSFNGVNAEGLIRLNADGTRNTISPLNLPFDAGLDTEIHSILIEDDGRIMVGGSLNIGWTGSGFKSGIIRLNYNGTEDNSFDPDAGAHDDGAINSLQRVYSIQKQHDGKYLIAGQFTAYDEHPARFIARINNNGTFDATFIPSLFDVPPKQGLIQANGRLVVAGNFTSPAKGVERLESTGSVDTTFYQQNGISFNAANPDLVRVFALAEDSKGQIWLGGNFFSYQDITTRPVIRIAGGVSPYALWVRENFTSAQIIAGVTNPEDDPDNDNIVNLAELAMGTDPNVTNATFAFAVDAGSGIEIVDSGGQSYLQISLTKPANPDGPWYAAQFSGDLNTWSPASPTPGSNEIMIIENSATRFTVRDTVPISTSNPRFGRIVLQIPE